MTLDRYKSSRFLFWKREIRIGDGKQLRLMKAGLLVLSIPFVIFASSCASSDSFSSKTMSPIANRSIDLPARTANINNEPAIENSHEESDHEYEPSWEDRAYDFVVNEYMKPRMAECGDSYFVLRGKTALYASKKPIQITVRGNIIPADELSEADKLNNKIALPERWKGHFSVKVLGPWSKYDNGSWWPWRDHSADTQSAGLEFKPGKGWQVYEGYYGNEPIYSILVPYKCVGNDINVASIPGGP